MAADTLTLNHICPEDLVRAFPGMPSTWDDDNLRKVVIGKIASYFGLPAQKIQDDNNPFMQNEYTETLDGSGTEWLYLKRYPVVAVTTIKQDNDTLSLTASLRQASTVDVWIMDDPVNGKYYGCLRRASGVPWVPGDNNYEITYVAGFNNASSPSPDYSNTFPVGLQGIIAEITACYYLKPPHLQSAKMGDIQYVYDNGIWIPKHLLNAIRQYKRKPYV